MLIAGSDGRAIGITVEINAGLSLTDCFNDRVSEIGIRLEAKTQARGSPHPCASTIQLSPKHRIRLP
jgi:hypothetical protein